jgi:aryl-alcohol dehydrogenase
VAVHADCADPEVRLDAFVLAGCNPIIAVDLRPGRLQLAREFGATYAVNSTEDDPVVAIRD